MNTDTEQPIVSPPETTEQTSPVFQPEITHKKTTSKKLPLIIGVMTIILVLIISAYYVKNHAVKSMPVAMKAISLKPTSIPTPTAEYKLQIYTANQEIGDSGVAINYPHEWTVNLVMGKTVTSSADKNNIKYIALSSPGTSAQAYMYISTSQPFQSIEAWFGDMLSRPVDSTGDFAWNKREYFTYTPLQIGNKTAYLILSSNKAPEAMKAGDEPGYIVLGNTRSYSIGFENGSDPDVVSQVKSVIFPLMIFK